MMAYQYAAATVIAEVNCQACKSHGEARKELLGIQMTDAEGRSPENLEQTWAALVNGQMVRAEELQRPWLWKAV